jgi:hypothetical protein
VRVGDKRVTSIKWKMGVPKKSKPTIFTMNRKSSTVMVKDKCCCLICNASVSLSRKGNPKLHYNALHSNKYDADFPLKSEIRKLKLKE